MNREPLRARHTDLARHGLGDEGGTVLLKQGNRRLGLGSQRVQLRRLGVEVGGDGLLLVEGREWEPMSPELFGSEVGDGCLVFISREASQVYR